MALAEHLRLPGGTSPARRDAVKHPTGYEPGFEWDGSHGYINTGPLPERPRTWDEFIRDSGLDPDEVEVVGPVNVRGWDANAGEGNVIRMHYYRLSVQRISTAALPDLRQLLKSARSSRMKAKELPEGVEKATVVCWADPQTGKVARRGGTAELIQRVDRYQEGIEAFCRRQKSDAAYMFDLGDAIEGFENTAGQMGTNDLSLMDQVDAATTIEFELFKTLGSLHPAAVLAGIGSNHCRWRNGKNQLGTPADDWGIHMLKQIHRRVEDSPEKYGHMSVRWPDTFEETISLDVAGLIIGATHGHQVARPEHLGLWWAKQTHGGQPIAHADILLHGHFHHFRIEPSGRNPYTDRDKWLIGAPTADGGSDWFRTLVGADSDPALLLFTVTSKGWDNLTLL